jgi:ADP-ribosyl-[dinitrogen reductase] hydrolase
MQAVLQALVNAGGFEMCLIDVVNRGGDADTTGAIAGMLAGALYGPKALPSRWRKILNPEVAAHVAQQARTLVAGSTRVTAAT